MSTFLQRTCSVSEVNEYIKSILDNDVIVSDIFIEAELSNFKKHISGHLYFTLKDDNAAISCVMFKTNAEYVNFDISNGMRLVAYGRISVYEKVGHYQLYVEHLQPSKINTIQTAFEKMKNKLVVEGLFDIEHKQDICEDPKCVAVITSKTGAAIQDILQIANRRNPLVKIVVVPVLVQGDMAASEIENAIQIVNEWGKADTIILGRGGGSTEDLCAFNEEIVARAIFNSHIPIISAVGHEIDITISDLVADMRVPTPSTAAEIAIPLLEDKRQILLDNICIMNDVITHTLKYKKDQNELLKTQLIKQMDYKLELTRLIAQNQIKKLELMSPVAILSRGYAIAYNKQKLIRTVEDVQINDTIHINLADGHIEATINKKCIEE